MERSLLYRIREASEYGVILNVLADCRKFLASEDEHRDAVAVVTALLERADVFCAKLSSTEEQTYFHSLFTVAPPLAVLLAVCDVLGTGHNWLTPQPGDAPRTPSSTIPVILITIVSGGAYESALRVSLSVRSDDDDRQLTRCRSFADHVVTLSDRVSVLFRGKRAIAFESIHPQKLCEAICSALTHAVAQIDAGTESVDLRVTAYLLAKARNTRMKDGRVLVAHVIEFVIRQKQPSGIWDRVGQRIFGECSLSNREHEQMVMAVAECANEWTHFMRCLGTSLLSSPVVRHVCTTRMLLQRACRKQTTRALARYVHAIGGDEMTMKVVEQTVVAWRDAVAQRLGGVTHCRHRTRVIVEFGYLIRGKTEFWKQLRLETLEGIHRYLESPDVSMRQIGMVMGEVISKWIGDERPLIMFTDDNPMDAFAEEMTRIANGESVKLVEEEDDVLLASLSGMTIRETAEEVGGAEKKEEPTNQKSEELSAILAELDSDDEDEPTYHVPDSERKFQTLKPGADPEKKMPAPVYLRECMAQLEEKEKYERFDAAFLNLEKLIRKRALGFDEIATTIVRKVILMEDRFNTKDFVAVKKGILAACFVQMPSLVTTATDLMFSNNCSMTMRYMILSAILSGAKELSGVSDCEEKEKEKEKPETKTKSVQPTRKPKEIPEWRREVEQRIERNTRRFGKGEPAKASEYANRFANVCHHFFYPLLRVNVGVHLDLVGRDHVLLARLLFAVSEILSFSVYSLKITRMIRSLMDFVYPLERHREPYLRSAVIYAYVVCVKCIPDQLLSSDCKAAIVLLRERAVDLNEDEHVRTLAYHGMEVISEKLDAVEKPSLLFETLKYR